MTNRIRAEPLFFKIAFLVFLLTYQKFWHYPQKAIKVISAYIRFSYYVHRQKKGKTEGVVCLQINTF